jgi:hypothetical protein
MFIRKKRKVNHRRNICYIFGKNQPLFYMKWDRSSKLMLLYCLFTFLYTLYIAGHPGNFGSYEKDLDQYGYSPDFIIPSVKDLLDEELFSRGIGAATVSISRVAAYFTIPGSVVFWLPGIRLPPLGKPLYKCLNSPEFREGLLEITEKLI